MKLCKAFFHLMLLVQPLFLFSQEYRYVQSIFPGSVKTAGIEYGTAPFLNSPYINESATTIKKLVMDIYQPQDDTLSKRPAIIFAHPGGFITGGRSVDDMVAFCDTFARKGYVTATIDYRKGLEIYDNPNLHYQRAAYRGIQDGRTAVRFLRAKADLYGIDPDRIYIVGSSAGSFIAINALTLDANELPEFVGPVSYSAFGTNYTGPDLGDPDIGENLSFKGTPDGVMGLWGGVDDTLKIGTNNTAPIFLVHGTADDVVPFNSGPPYGYSSLSDVFGSNPISLRLASLGIPAADTYFVTGQGHEFHGASNGSWENGIGGNRYWDTLVKRSTAFFWQIHKPDAMFSYQSNTLEISFFDESNEAAEWYWDFGDGSYSIEQNPIHSYDSEGNFPVKLLVRNDILSWDTTSMLISVIDNTGLDDLLSKEICVYPVPAHGTVNIKTDIEFSYDQIRIFNASGQEMHFVMKNIGNLCVIDIEGWLPGIYGVSFVAEKIQVVKKLIAF